MVNMGEQYFTGVLAGYLGANFMFDPITEWQISRRTVFAQLIN